MIGDITINQDASASSDAAASDTSREHWLDRPLLASLNWEHVLYGLILLIAIVSRLYDLGVRVMSHDESLHTLYSQYLVSGRGYQHSPLMHGPFLFHITALSYFLFGDSDYTARLPFALIGIGIVMLPALFRRELGRAGALSACALLLISPSILYHARYIRQEASILLWTMLTVLCIWRYLKSQRDGWLIGLAAVLALHGADKATSFLSVAVFLIFLAPLALWQLYRMRNDRRDALNGAILAAVAGAALLLAAILFSALSGRLATLFGLASLITPADASVALNPRSLGYIGVIAGLATLYGAGFVQLLRRFFGDWMRRAHDGAPAFNLIVILVMTTTLMGSAALLPLLNPLWKAVTGETLMDVTLLGSDANIKSNPQVITTMLALGIAVAMIGIALGVFWNWERAATALAVYVGITLPLFTTIFTNLSGVGTGYVGQLGYWMAQQEVNRGSQPGYYYFLIVPLYEYLTVLGTLAALVVLGRGALLALRARALPAWIGAQLFPLLVTWWIVATWVIYSVAGEKMPWLTVHFALPQSMLTAWLIQRAANRIRLRADESGPIGLARPLMPRQLMPRMLGAAGLALLAALFAVRILALLGGYDGAASDAAAGRSAIVALLANGLLALIALGAAVYAMRKLLARGVPSAIGLAGLGLLALLTIRTAVTVTYINYDYTKEFLFYAHGAPGVKIVTAQLDDLQRRLGGNAPLTVGYTQETSWPMSWYMRSYAGARFLGASLPADADSTLQAIVASSNDKDFSAWEEQLAPNYTRFDYTMVWWPMEDYKDLNWNRVSYSLSNPQARNALWEIAFNRNYVPYSKLYNKNTFEPDTWSPSHRMSLFVRNDVASQIWDYRAGQVANGGAVKPAGPKMQQPANIAIAPDGARWVIDHKSNRLFKLDKDNNVETSFGGAGAQPGRFNDPWGLAIDAQGGIFVADTFNHRIQKFDASGTMLSSWGSPGASSAPGEGHNTQFFGPRDIAMTADGRLLVSDTGNKRIQVFDAEGNYLAQFGAAGAGDGELSEPVGLAVGADGDVFVADTWNKRIQVFGADFKFKRAFAVPAWETMDPNLLTSVEHKPYLAIDGATLFVSSPRTGQVLGFTFAGAPVDLPNIVLTAEDWPTGLKVSAGVLYVTNAKNGTVVAFPLR